LIEGNKAGVLVATPDERLARRLGDRAVLLKEKPDERGYLLLDVSVLKANPVAEEFVSSPGLALFRTPMIDLTGLDRLDALDPLRLAAAAARLIDQALRLRKPPTAAEMGTILSILQAVARFA
jgi:hypothetical protein